MPSRAQLTPIPKNRTPVADDVNAIYAILNGSYTNATRTGAVMGTTTRGLGMPIRLTGFDGRMATGLIDTTSYALDVRNREATQQLALAVRRADNQIAFRVGGGKAYAPFNGGASVAGQVLVNGSTAGGVLGGTYPDPTFWLATEQYVLRPKMIMMWYGSNATVLIGGNQELQDSPGWVLCNGATVFLRAGGSVVAPDLRDRYPIGAGGTYSLGNTAGNSLATQQSVSTAHTHGISHDHAHEHTVQNHAHNMNNHSHDLSNHTHDLTHTHSMNSHTHGLNGHTHGLNNHTHSLSSHTHTQLAGHVHSMLAHTHSGSTLTAATSATPLNFIYTTFNTSGGVALNHTHPITGDTGIPSGTGNTGSNFGIVSDGPNTPNTGIENVANTGANFGTTDGPTPGSTLGASTSTTSVPSFNVTGAPSAATTATDGTHSTTAKTASTSIPNTLSQSASTINAQPPTIALWFIMKL